MLGLVGWKIVGVFVVAVIHAARHQRPIGVALEKTDDHLHADARNKLSTPLLAGVNLGDANRTGFLRLAVPKELDPDASMFVGADLFAVLAFLRHDLGGLDTIDARLRRQRQTPEGAVARLEEVRAIVALSTLVSSAAAILLRGVMMRYVDNQILAVFL